MEREMDILFKTEDRPELDNITKLIKAMSESEQNKILIFLQGVNFAESLKSQQERQKAMPTQGQQTCRG